MFCKSCGNTLLSSARFCGKCGTPVLQAASALPEETPCPTCKVPNKPGAKFCKSCGQLMEQPIGTATPVSAPVPEPVPAVKDGRSSQHYVMAGILCGALLLVLGVVAWVFFSPPPIKEERVKPAVEPARPTIEPVAPSVRQIPEPPPLIVPPPLPPQIPQPVPQPAPQPSPAPVEPPVTKTRPKPPAKQSPSDQDKAKLDKANRTLDDLLN